jgi:hypothetical protein
LRDHAGKCRPYRRGRSKIEIVEGDASAFAFPPGYVIVYLCSPVYPRLLDRLAERIAAPHVAGNKVMVIYYNPAFAKSFDRRAAFAPNCAAPLPRPKRAAA